MKIKNISQYVLDFIENNQNEDIKEKWTSKKNLKAFEKIILKTSGGIENEENKVKQKKAKTSYLIFCDENRASVIEDNPKFISSQIISELGNRWNILKKENPDKIKEYQQKSLLEKENRKKLLEQKKNTEHDNNSEIIDSKKIDYDSEDDKIIEIKKPKPVKSNDKKSNIENKLAEPIDSDSNTGDENNAFENYVSKRKNKIKEKYPYLDEQGILKKLKKKWKHLSDDKKNKF